MTNTQASPYRITALNGEGRTTIAYYDGVSSMKVAFASNQSAWIFGEEKLHDFWFETYDAETESWDWTWAER